MSEDAHLICFNEKRDKSLDRLDFVLFAVTEHEPVAYMTCREHDADTIYLSHGGKLPSRQGTLGAFKAYVAMLRRLKTMRYKRALTLIENTNRDMLRSACKVGWIITGITARQGKILVEHTMEF
jgi:hypothetical protein